MKRRPVKELLLDATPTPSFSKRLDDPAFHAERRMRGNDAWKRLSPAERVAVYAHDAKRRFPGLDEREFRQHLVNAHNLLRSPVAPVEMNNPVEDLALAWSQPEAVELWCDWASWIRGARAPAYEGSRACAVATSALKYGPHYRAGHAAVRSNPRLQAPFHALAQQSGRANGIVVREYSASTRHLVPLAENLAEAAMRACVNVVRDLSASYPNAKIGHYLQVDGTAAAAWVEQRGAKRNGKFDPRLEAHIRRRVPDAAYRAIGYDRDGSFDPARDPQRRSRGRMKDWRGYLFVALVDAVTALPLVGTLVPANEYEPNVLTGLLAMLFQQWPDAPTEAVIGDALYDIADLSGELEARYGIHPIFKRKPTLMEKGGRMFKDGDREYRGGVARIGGDGVAFCREHGLQMSLEGTEVPSRIGLRPGEPRDSYDFDRRARRFRSRWSCSAGCRSSLPTRLAWSTAPYYPHNPYGRPDLYAFRTLALARRNGVESVFASMKGSHKQGLRGPCRTRLLDRRAYEMLLWLALVQRPLLTVAAERMKRE